MPANNLSPNLTVFKGASTQEERRQTFVESGWLVSIPLSIVSSHWLLRGEQRLDGEYYAAGAVSALRAIHDGNFEIRTVQEITKPVYYPGRFKRIYAKTITDGMPFLTASEMLHFRPASNEFLANSTNYIDACKVQAGLILVTRSGTVGRCVVVGKRLSNFAITDDALRVQVSLIPAGYLYAYFMSWVGQALITKDQYGSAIKHLEPHHLANVPVPLLPDGDQEIINNEIMRAYGLRDEANALLDEADELLHRELDLPRFNETQASYLPTKSAGSMPFEMPHPKPFSIPASDLEERLDASFHNPIARLAVHILKSGKYQLTQLSKVTNDIVVAPRFKRIYVAKEYGVPFLQGSHLPQMRPNDLKYLSSTQQSRLERWIVRKGWVLVTCSGTIGRVGLVSSRLDKWAASQHLLRILPDYTKGHPGYITAFLMTPYGQHQVIAKTYGGIVDEITAEDTGKIWIPDVPMDIQTKIGNIVVTAFEKKDEANATEEAAIKRLEMVLEKQS
jgi:type I restriction enzyme S subunit